MATDHIPAHQHPDLLMSFDNDVAERLAAAMSTRGADEGRPDRAALG